MNKKKTLIKAPLREEYLKNVVNEKVSYIELPLDFEEYSLEEDIKKGGVQYSKLTELTKKKKISRVISLSADSEEMGLMAVAYLAMNLVKRRGGYDAELFFDNDSIGQHWIESEIKIPVININELIYYMRNKDNSFESHGFLIAQSQAKPIHRPYWCSCIREAVCIVVRRASIDSTSLNYINLFAKNKNVFVLFLEGKVLEEEMMDELPFGCMDTKHFQALRNNFVLSNASDAVEVSLGDCDGQLYYRNVVKQNLNQRGIKVGKGFSYVRVVHLATSINKEGVCGMIDKIINYAIKDVESEKMSVLGNKDFDFIDSFMREQSATGEYVNGRKLLEQNLVGIDDIKQQVYDVVNVMKYNKIRSQMNIPGSRFHNVHVMLGAPGTAKTTVARYMGEMMFNEKLLPDNRFICINGAELKGMYVGHSAPKTKALFVNYDVIIIDEAYSIVEATGATDSFGNEAIAQLIIELENHSTDKLIIFAGYGGDVEEKDNRMQAFLDSNPGIKSRITSTFYFKSYSAKEMAVIFKRIAKNSNYDLQEGTEKLVEMFFQSRVSMRDFGNGREARVLLETAVIYAAKRTMSMEKAQYTSSEMRLLTLEDVKAAIQKMSNDFGSKKAVKNQIGFAG